jgi:hypothetical protein
METKKNYEEKLNKLQAKANSNLQKLISTAFEVVMEATDLDERMKEVKALLDAEAKEVKK